VLTRSKRATRLASFWTAGGRFAYILSLELLVLLLFWSDFNFLDLSFVSFSSYLSVSSGMVCCFSNADFQFSPEIELASCDWFDYHARGQSRMDEGVFSTVF
jgi:hypothetical protein